MENLISDPGMRLKLLMLGVLVFVLFKPIKSIVLGVRSKNWRKTRATISVSGLDRESGVYYPKIIYNYTVNGRALVDDNYTFVGAITNSKARALAIARDNPVGKEISIYVSPDDSARTVVVPGVHWSAYANVVFLVVFFTGIAFIVEILNMIWPGCQPNCS
ncbi:MAG: DUF3592 domain-containing protein [Pseudomonas sp.]